MRRLRNVLLILLAAGAGLFILTVTAWGVDSRAHDGKVARNVDLAGTPVGGLTRANLAAAVNKVQTGYDKASVYVVAPKGSFVTDAAGLGVRLEPQRTVDATMAVGRSGGFFHELGSWLRGLVKHRRAPVQVSIDPAAVFRVVPKLDPGPQSAPVEPTIKLEGSHLVAVDGKPGQGINPAEVVRRLPEAARRGTPITVRVHRGQVPARFAKGDADKLVDRAEGLTKTALPVKAGSQTATVPVKTLRSWLRAAPGDRSLDLAVDADKAAADLAALMPKAGTPPVETTFTVVGDVPQVVAGSPGTGCCSASSADLVLGALNDRPAGGKPIVLPLKKVDPSLTVDAAKQLGIVEKVSTFTTPHQCCQPRVHNIHLIADTVRGQVIKPGDTFSVNTFVGQRTLAKGYVVAPVIYEGKEDEDVGGGISQFATTTFNAAFFAGLDFAEYQTHSIWISRYPYGREATLSWPHPDLKIKNTTPYGILIWPTYTETSLTVTFYSTHWVQASQTNQTSAPSGVCTRVNTERTRVYPDGTKKVDHIFALYQPKDGVKCTG
jgi:vancomycin resistance protein YoaR